VSVTVEKNGILHIVKRNSETKEISIKIGADEFRRIKEDEVRKLLPIQSYSQKQFSDVGIRTEELKRFIEQPILTQLEDLKFKLSETVIKTKSSYGQLIRKKEIEQEINIFNLEQGSIKTQIENLRKSLKGISDSDQQILSQKSKYAIERILIDISANELDIFHKKTDELLKLLEIYPESQGNLEQVENKELIQAIISEAHNKFGEIKYAVGVLKNIFNEDSFANFNTLIQAWKMKESAFEKNYEIAKNNSHENQQQLQEMQNLESRFNEISTIISDKINLLKEISDPENEFIAQRKNWKQYHLEKMQLLNQQAHVFSDLFKKLIKAEVAKNIDLRNFKTKLKNIFEGSRIRGDKIDAIVEYIEKSDAPLDEYLLVIDEFKLLSENKISAEKELNVLGTQILTNCGFTEEQIAKISVKITKDNWLNCTDELEFCPEFFYATNSSLGDAIPFADASAGQQATALLTVLLNQPGMPLLIDQPEDDIDNRAIELIIKNIWDAKKKRQLIFTSHNANLVVNGDAELVICCDYKDFSNQTQGIIKTEGAIDKEAVRDEITAVMEGAKKPLN